MRKILPEFFERTQQEFREIWKTCIFVLDTNILLHIIRQKKEVSGEIITVLTALSDRIWIPYQVAKEFHQNKHKTIFDLEKPVERVISAIDKARDSISEEIDSIEANLRYHPKFEYQNIKSFMSQEINSLKEKFQIQFGGKVEESYFEDLIGRIDSLFDGKTGSQLPSEETSKLASEAAKRQTERIPPGFNDAQKDGDRRFGDFFIWNEMLNISKTTDRPVVFITEDLKDDWWLRVSGRTIGPRPELIREMLDFSGKFFHMYNLTSFLKYSREQKIGAITNPTLEAIQAEAAIRERRLLDREIFDRRIRKIERMQEDLHKLSSEREAIRMRIEDLKAQTRNADSRDESDIERFIEELSYLESKSKATESQIIEISSEMDFNKRYLSRAALLNRAVNSRYLRRSDIAENLARSGSDDLRVHFSSEDEP